MRRYWKKCIVRNFPRTTVLLIQAQTIWSVVAGFRGIFKRECPVCGHEGYFFACGSPLRYDAVCPRCLSRERHRQHALLVARHPDWIEGKSVLHFAAERCLVDGCRTQAAHYCCVDLDPGPDEVSADIQDLSFSTSSFHTVICHQVLEHVPDDRAALCEIRRVLMAGGRAILSTPIVEAWTRTYRNDALLTPTDRQLHFNQVDHLRIYGRDLRDLIRSAGFQLDEFVAQEPDVSRYGLLRGEVIFIATKPS